MPRTIARTLSHCLLQAKQLFLRMVSLLCYGHSGSLATADFAHMCELIVLINHGSMRLDPRFFGKDQTITPKDLQALHVRCLDVVASRSSELVNAMRGARQHLTSAFKKVSALTRAML